MDTDKNRASVLANRIKAGKADPISEKEKILVNKLRAGYIKKYGSLPKKIRK